jgi:Protein of unknown function (DUF1488)
MPPALYHFGGNKGQRMGQLAFLNEDKLFDGEVIRFTGFDGKDEVTCGVTIAALKAGDPGLQRHGLIPAEAFLASFDALLVAIHDAARRKYQRGEFESEGGVRIVVHRRDLSP